MLAKKKTLPVMLLSLFICSGLKAQNVLITGKILDQKSKPIISASVKVKNSNNGTISDSLGQFSINVKPDAILLLSAIGYADSSIAVAGQSYLLIRLQPSSKNLREVIVSHENMAEDSRRKQIADAMNDYLNQEVFLSSTLSFQPSFTASLRNDYAPSGSKANSLRLYNVNYGAMLPIIEHKEDTRGSRYLFPKYVKGLTIDTGLHATNYTTKMLNFDKIDGRLMVQMDPNNFLEVDNNIVDAFAFKTEDTALIFLKVPILSKTNYFILIANGPKYSAYKSIRSKFIKSNYISNGLTESGNNFDQYVDISTYYWVDQTEDKAGLFELKKKSIKEIFPSQKSRVDAFWVLHKSEDIDENFVRNLIHYLNN